MAHGVITRFGQTKRIDEACKLSRKSGIIFYILDCDIQRLGEHVRRTSAIPRWLIDEINEEETDSRTVGQVGGNDSKITSRIFGFVKLETVSQVGA